jgi:hypothetical protein
MDIYQEKQYKEDQKKLLEQTLEKINFLAQNLPEKIEKREDFLLDTSDFQDAFEDTEDSVALFVFPRKSIVVGVNRGQVITEYLNVISQYNDFLVYEYDNIVDDNTKIKRLEFIFNNIDSTITRIETVITQFDTAISNENNQGSRDTQSPQDTYNTMETQNDNQEQTQPQLNQQQSVILNLYNTAFPLLGKDPKTLNNIYYFVVDHHQSFAGIFLNSLKKNLDPREFASILVNFGI